jgi:photosystem II stability/assembly factor-like uncharacterized protein
MSSTSNYINVSSGHIDSLINYVVDVKPYHVKLSAVVEQYLFEDTVNAKITEEHKLLAFLGADILPATSQAPGVRARRSSSWFRDVVSDGQRRVWPAPLTSVHKLASHSSQEKFTCGVNDDFQIPGIGPGVFNQKRWDGPGITDVSHNGEHQQDSFDYFLSHGVYSFDIRPLGRWKELNIAHVPAFAENPGELFYLDVVKSFGTISNIVGGNYEEWTIKCINDDIGIFDVIGSSSGFIGNVEFNNTFTHSLISFSFFPSAGDSEPFFSDGLSDINDDDQGLIDVRNFSSQSIFTLTPFNKITVAPDAPIESWSLIKTNPIALTSKPQFYSPMIGRLDVPALEVHTRSLDRATEDATWIVTFGAQGTYTVQKISFSQTYINSENLRNGCSFKNDDVHFTILPTTTGFYPGDSFTFTSSARVENYLVFGSISGYQANAKIGEWYWNGKIGFKIPALDYFPHVHNTTIITSKTADINSWQTVVSNNQILKSVSYANGFFLTAGENSIVGASADGKVWSSDVASNFTPVPNTILTVVGAGGSIGTSTDGNLWLKQESHTTHNLNDTANIPNLLSLSLLDPAPTVNSILVVGDHGTILTSVNGSGWADQNSGTLQNLNGIAWSNDGIIVVGSNGTILKSLDRISWVHIPCPTGSNLNKVIYDISSSSFIAVGDNGSIIKSTDGGDTWLYKGNSALVDYNLTSIASGDGRLVAVSPNGLIVTSFSAGDSWPSQQFGRKLNSITYGEGAWVAVGGKSDENIFFKALKTVHSIAEPSVYTITFTSATTATVVNNIYGYRKGVTYLNPASDGNFYIHVEDEFVEFSLQVIPNQFQYQAGDIVTVHLAPRYTYAGSAWYDENFYDFSPYDTGIADLTTALLYNEELFPLYHSHGSVIFKTCNAGDKIIIDKAFLDLMRFRILASSSTHPELAAIDDWVPLEFRYYDRLTSGAPSSEAHFSDLTTYIEAYLSSDPSVRVLSIAQPRFEKTNRNTSATLTFDAAFFLKYMKFKTKYSVLYLPDDSYGQRLRVKITENLRTYARVRLIFDEIALININDSPVQHFHIIGDIDFIDVFNVQFVEGGALPIDGGYDVFPYDVFNYDQRIHNGVLSGLVEVSPGVYDWTGNPEDYIMPKPTLSPSIFIEETPNPDAASTSFVEGLFIAEKIVGQPIIERLHVNYDVNINTSGLVINQQAEEYVITHNGPPATPTLSIESLNNLGVFASPMPNLYPYLQIPTALSLKSFSFTLPPGFSAPFKLTVA